MDAIVGVEHEKAADQSKGPGLSTEASPSGGRTSGSRGSLHLSQLNSHSGSSQIRAAKTWRNPAPPLGWGRLAMEQEPKTDKRG